MIVSRSLQFLGAVLSGAAVSGSLLVCSGLMASTALAAEPVAAVAPLAGAPRVALLNTGKPGGWFGYYGFDVSSEQRVAGRFTVSESGDYKLTRIGVWLMNNSDTEQATVKLSLQTDALDEQGTESLPSGVKLERWEAPVGTYGWSPVHQYFKSAKRPHLKAGHNYWVVAESKAAPGADPIWLVAAKGLLVSTTSYMGQWQPAGESGALTLRVDAKPVLAD
jgi:hypothetical protein